VHRGGPLILGEGADATRRLIGPTAWSALEVLASRAVDDGGATVAVSSVRDVAGALGVAKNTAHRAIRTLVASGLATPDQHRAPDGRFTTSAYRLTVPADVLQRVPHEPCSPRAAPSRRQPRPTRSSGDAGTQLDLLANCD